MSLDHGVFTVSLDFELYWGVRDKHGIDQYRDNLAGVGTAIREMLKVFETHGIHATWATVGFLFFESLGRLKQNLPASLPRYSRNQLCPYRYIERADTLDPLYHFAPELIGHIAAHRGQEIATHTFSHYYCLEDGQSASDFKADITSAMAAAQSRGMSIESLVFPRNQWNPDYLSILNEMGIRCYRGNASGWIHRATDDSGQNRLRRAIRLLDAYFNISGHHTYTLAPSASARPHNFPASRFLRPYSRNLSFLDGLRLNRITKAMDDAAIRHRIFHLWWHPHNFGKNTAQNTAFLERIAAHYCRLRENHGMRSLNMGELCTLAESANA
ncbi:polysaccharide deacetylase family protein [Methylococcus geothermalis]|uniref:Polysaccharide deacetylase family protein n=1 Tax=Methylococcus geothermalis TaxID=2681310 RepID=A0A858QBQ4_9GAMM|nr:polysaccharide deacetylase family protein [Methylococcus geothermalis]QJD31134.1 polysaccharide deacetylase family protein [Methylococcus geothermalis]